MNEASNSPGATPPPLAGLVILDKPVGRSSRQALDRLRRLTHTRHAGYSGTLDPLASGVLPCALGTATRLLSYLEDHTKRYQATVELGRETNTDDAEGREVAAGDWTAVSRASVESALTAFRGTIRQRPPAFSAISIGGQRLYALARKGEAVDVPEREVNIEALTLLDWAPPRLTLDVRCSKGTYIRALARDLGRALGCRAYLAGLRRTASGPFTLRRAVTLDELEGAVSAGTLSTYVLPLLAAVPDLPRHVLDGPRTAAVANGQIVRLPDAADGSAALVDANGTLLAVAQVTDGQAHPEKVFVHAGNGGRTG